MLPLGSNHLLCYVRLDERAKDLRTTTSPTQALSDECPNNFCLITAVKITTLFRPGSNLSSHWTHKRSSRSSEPPQEDSNATKTRHNNYRKNWNNWYLLNYLTLFRLLPTNETTKRLNVLVLGINRNWQDVYATKNRGEVNRTTTR